MWESFIPCLCSGCLLISFTLSGLITWSSFPMCFNRDFEETSCGAISFHSTCYFEALPKSCHALILGMPHILAEIWKSQLFVSIRCFVDLIRYILDVCFKTVTWDLAWFKILYQNMCIYIFETYTYYVFCLVFLAICPRFMCRIIFTSIVSTPRP